MNKPINTEPCWSCVSNDEKGHCTETGATIKDSDYADCGCHSTFSADQIVQHEQSKRLKGVQNASMYIKRGIDQGAGKGRIQAGG